MPRQGTEMGRLGGERQRLKLNGLEPKRPLEETKKTRGAHLRPCWRARMLITERVPEPVMRGSLIMGPLRRGSAASAILRNKHLLFGRSGAFARAFRPLFHLSGLLIKRPHDSAI